MEVPDVERDDELEAMRAERAITKAMLRYTRGIDRCDEELLRSAYHDDAYDDHGDRFRGPAREFIPWTLGHLRKRFVSTMHTLHNIDIDVNGDWARAETYCISQHVVRADDGQLRLETFACRYLDRFEDRPGAGWRIAHRVVVRGVGGPPADAAGGRAAARLRHRPPRPRRPELRRGPGAAPRASARGSGFGGQHLRSRRHPRQQRAARQPAVDRQASRR